MNVTFAVGAILGQLLKKCTLSAERLLQRVEGNGVGGGGVIGKRAVKLTRNRQETLSCQLQFKQPQQSSLSTSV